LLINLYIMNKIFFLNFLYITYITFEIIVHFNRSIFTKILIYFFLDNIYLLFFEKNNPNKKELVIHHVNLMFMLYCQSNIDQLNIYDYIFSCQELTTLLLFLKRIFKNSLLENSLNYLFLFLWILLRLIGLFVCIIGTYKYYYQDSLYFYGKIYSGFLFYILNLKWTLIKINKMKNKDHWLSICLFIPIYFLPFDVFKFTVVLVSSIGSYCYFSIRNSNHLLQD